jgi:hypothetical protein
MAEIQMIVDLLARNIPMVNATLADFSDTEMLVRPCPGANHAAWQLGHLVVAEANMTNAAIQEGAIQLPQGFAEKFKKETASMDDPSFFPKKAELLALLAKGRDTIIGLAKGLQPADLAKPTPDRLQRFAPTVGELLLMYPVHVAMHTGQWQVIRRKLGKPLLF